MVVMGEALCSKRGWGGLGCKNLKKFNIAMLAKQVKRLINNDNPPVSGFTRVRYFPNRNLLNAKIGANPRYMCWSILAAQEITKRGCRRRIGNGKDTRIRCLIKRMAIHRPICQRA